MASHNAKYYVKSIRKKDASKCRKLDTFFKKTNDKSDDTQNIETQPDQSDSQSETAGPLGEDIPSDKSKKPADVNPSTCESDDSDDGDSESTSGCRPKFDKRTFDSNRYEISYKWLYWSAYKNGYICKFCEMFSSHGPKWIDTGVKLGTHPSRKLQKHETSVGHKKACERYAECHSKVMKHKVPVTVMDQLVLKDSKDRERNREILKKLFRIAYFITRKRWAQTNFEDVVKFVASLGVEDLQHHLQSAPSNATYLSDTSVVEFIDIIGEFIENDQLVSIRNANYFTLLADESCDEQNREQLSVFAKWTCQDRQTLPLVDHFLGLINVAKTDAQSLLQAIQQFLLAKNLDVSRCRFVGFDGTNTMSGETSGLQRRMRNLSPMLLYMNCRSHRLALCLKHLMSTYPVLVEADEVLLAIWKLFHFSPRRFEIFKHVQEVYGCQPLNVIRAAATRWLSHGQACIRFIERYEVILDTLDTLYQERKEPEVFGLRASITNRSVVAMILLLCDILKPLNVLCLYLQDPKICFVDIESKVKATTNELENLIGILQAPNYQNRDIYFAKVGTLYQEIDDRTDLQMRRRRDFQRRNISPAVFVETIGIPFIHSLIGEMTDAFVCHPVFTAFRSLDPRCLPQQLDALAEFGEADIQTLANHYGTPKEDHFRGHVTRCGPDIDSTVVLKTEYTSFKHQMYMLR